jgi:hypothetical protein
MSAKIFLPLEQNSWSLFSTNLYLGHHHMFDLMAFQEFTVLLITSEVMFELNIWIHVAVLSSVVTTMCGQ